MFMLSGPWQKPPQSKLLVDDLIEPPVWEATASALDSTDKKSRGTLRSIRNHDWVTGVLYMLCDTACWVVLYGIVGYVRRDQFFVSPFEFLVVDCVVLAVILQALYIIGGLKTKTEKPGLIYPTDAILSFAADASIRYPL